MNEPLPTPAVPPFKDRRAGLIALGILEILLGAGCALMIPLMVFGQLMAANMSGAPPSLRMIIPAALIYVVLAVTLIWLGIGSIKCRRWARGLLLILSWSWLAVGIISVAAMVFLLPRILSAGNPGGPGMPPGAVVAVMVVSLVVLGVLFVAVPAVMVLFYRSGHVQATCEARDPVARWTDASPLPVLAVTCWLWFGGATMLLMPLGYNGVLPCFGTLLSGVLGGLVCVALAALWFWLGWMFYKVRPAGWWILVGVMLLLILSNVLTFTRVDLMEMYQQMGYPEAQIEMIRKQGWLTNSTMLWWSVAAMVPILGYLLWVRRFFGGPRDAGAAVPGAGGHGN
jgi:hypothetical protein